MTNTQAPKKITYIATAPDGEEFPRKSSRVYTHAVLVFGQNWYTQKHNLPSKWFQLGFAGRPDLAQKLVDKERKYNPAAQVVIVEAVVKV